MRYHIQGVFVLLFTLIALLVVARIAAPVMSDARDQALVAESSDAEDIVDLAAGATELAVPLTLDEVAELQADLTTLGFEPGPVDGILGAGTRAAMDDAIATYRLDSTSTDRDVFEYVGSLADALAAAAAADNAGNDQGDAVQDPTATATAAAGG